MNNDDEHLRLLSIFHYVYAGVVALGATFPVIHVAIGAAFVIGEFDQPREAGPFPGSGSI